MADKLIRQLAELVRRDGRYPLEAFEFLNHCVGSAVKQVYGDVEAQASEGGVSHHVTGRQLCEAVRNEAIERWGLLAKTVLAKWNIHATLDFGNMVFLLVDNGIWKKTEEDSLEDFRDVYDFDEALGPGEVFQG